MKPNHSLLAAFFTVALAQVAFCDEGSEWRAWLSSQESAEIDLSQAEPVEVSYEFAGYEPWLCKRVSRSAIGVYRGANQTQAMSFQELFFNRSMDRYAAGAIMVNVEHRFLSSEPGPDGLWVIRVHDRITTWTPVEE